MRDSAVEVEVDHSRMESAPILGAYTPVALDALIPYALHLTQERDPYLWWHEKHYRPGSHEGERSMQLVDPWDCFSRFCALHNASDEAVFNFAERYGVLGIWPCRREACVTDLAPQRRGQLEVPGDHEHPDPWMREIWGGASWSDTPQISRIFVKPLEQWEEGERKIWEEGSGKLWEEYDQRLIEWRKERLQNEHLYADLRNCTWYGEPISLWRHLAKHLRALTRIGAMLHRGELGTESDWSDVLLPGEMGCWRSRDASGVWNPLPPFEAQQTELEALINRWLPNVDVRLLLRLAPSNKMKVFLEAAYFDGSSWTPQDYEKCAAHGLATGDLRSLSGWNRDLLRDFKTRPSVLLNFLILQLTATITAGAAFCPRCGNPTPAHGTSGKRLPVTKTYCAGGCKAEARKETKRNSWRKANRKAAA